MNGDGNMKIISLSLENYKAFKELEFQIDGNNVVLFGINGAGKSSILQGINSIFSRIINNIVGKQFRQNINIDVDDVRIGSRKTRLSAEFQFDDEILPFGFSFDSITKNRAANRKQLATFSDHYEEYYFENENPNVVMPIFVSYAVNRSVLDVPLRIRTKHNFNRLEAYRNAVEPRIDFRTFFEWFRNQSDVENQEKVARRSFEYSNSVMNAVRQAINNMIPEFTNLQIERTPLRMVVENRGQTLEINQLSDGQKCLLAMIGDLVRRLALANPNLENPLMGTGIVLIDEIELHLHPAWQRKVVSVLHETFPNVQFIVSTQSPQVLGELPESFSVYRVMQECENEKPYSYIELMEKGEYL